MHYDHDHDEEQLLFMQSIVGNVIMLFIALCAVEIVETRKERSRFEP